LTDICDLPQGAGLSRVKILVSAEIFPERSSWNCSALAIQSWRPRDPIGRSRPTNNVTVYNKQQLKSVRALLPAFVGHRGHSASTAVWLASFAAVFGRRVDAADPTPDANLDPPDTTRVRRSVTGDEVGSCVKGAAVLSGQLAATSIEISEPALTGTASRRSRVHAPFE
jgi:hypothetical protein